MNWLETLIKCGVRATTAARWAPVFAEAIKPGTFSAGDAELDDFIGQVLHESNRLERLVEDLRYSATRMCEVWPKRFPSLAAAAPYAHNPEALANKVYGGRLGNVRPGDGWRYRGRGLVQVTGRANYAAVGRALGLPLEQQPELLETPRIALLASIAWWERNVPDAFVNNPVKVTQAVNGGTAGLADRVALTNKAREGLA